MDDLEELWILEESGICLFNYSKTQQIDPNLLSGFITAIRTMSLRLTNMTIDTISFKNMNFIIYKDGVLNLLFVLSTKKENLKKTKKVLLKIIEEFKERYGKQIMSGWDHDTAIFSPFAEVVDEYFNSLIDKKIKKTKGMW
ncbi:MAG: hypothetical protein ACTSVC_00435 [Promethearchaeota archaeon]